MRIAVTASPAAAVPRAATGGATGLRAAVGDAASRMGIAVTGQHAVAPILREGVVGQTAVARDRLVPDAAPVAAMPTSPRPAATRAMAGRSGTAGHPAFLAPIASGVAATGVPA